MSELNYSQLAQQIKTWGEALGFTHVAICDTDLSHAEPTLQAWLDKQYHGEMAWMASHGMLRARPAELLPGTLRVISVAMRYFPDQAHTATVLSNPEQAYISRYALGRDYHKLMRKRLKQLAEQIKAHCQQLNYRPFVDSAPIMERALAQKAGIGWQGKHSLILNQQGSWFFLGELLINLPLPVDAPTDNQCGSCQACLQTCPTGAIVAPYVVDARRCISYLTIEYNGVIPTELRPLMGNRIYGCDDCQLVCPWNRQPHTTQERDFLPRHQLDSQSLLELYQWDEATFLQRTEGSAIRRIGYIQWLRNITIALGNAPYQAAIVSALQQRYGLNPLLDEHIDWALQQQFDTKTVKPEPSRKQQRLNRLIQRFY